MAHHAPSVTSYVDVFGRNVTITTVGDITTENYTDVFGRPVTTVFQNGKMTVVYSDVFGNQKTYIGSKTNNGEYPALPNPAPHGVYAKNIHVNGNGNVAGNSGTVIMNTRNMNVTGNGIGNVLGNVHIAQGIGAIASVTGGTVTRTFTNSQGGTTVTSDGCSVQNVIGNVRIATSDGGVNIAQGNGGVNIAQGNGGVNIASSSGDVKNVTYSASGNQSVQSVQGNLTQVFTNDDDESTYSATGDQSVTHVKGNVTQVFHNNDGTAVECQGNVNIVGGLHFDNLFSAQKVTVALIDVTGQFRLLVNDEKIDESSGITKFEQSQGKFTLSNRVIYYLDDPLSQNARIDWKHINPQKSTTFVFPPNQSVCVCSCDTVQFKVEISSSRRRLTLSSL